METVLNQLFEKLRLEYSDVLLDIRNATDQTDMKYLETYEKRIQNLQKYLLQYINFCQFQKK
jgi:hypothetical protein